MDNLFMILVLVGFVGIIVSLIQLVIKFFRKQGKDRRNQLLIFIAVFVISLFGFSKTYEKKEDTVAESEINLAENEVVEEDIEDEKVAEDVEQEKQTEVREETTVGNIAGKTEETIEKDDVDKVLEMLESSFKSTANVSVDRELQIFSLTPKGDFKRSIISLADSEGKDKTLLKGWNDFVDATAKVSKPLNDILGGYYIEVINPANVENTLLLLFEGKVIYNFVNDY